VTPPTPNTNAILLARLVGTSGTIQIFIEIENCARCRLYSWLLYIWSRYADAID